MRKKIVLAAALVAVMTMFSACALTKTAASDAEFVSLAEGRGFEIVDISEQYEPEVVESVTIALNEDYQLEFYVMTSTENAMLAFSQSKENFENNKSGAVSTNVEFTGTNYHLYRQTDGEAFYIVTQVDNTVFYCVAPLEDEEEVAALAEELGYN